MLIAASLGVLAAIVSIKPYLGLPRHSWDPAVLGAALMGSSLWLKRRLDGSPDGRRDGWTAKPLIAARSDGPDAAGLLAAAVAAPAGPPAAGEKRFSGGGGSFGGGGASGSF